MDFQCSKCGSCCRRAGQLNIMPQRDDGACVHLSIDNSCKIYETRPDFCRVSNMAILHNQKTGIPILSYFKIASMICNNFIREDNLDKSFLIDVGAYDRSDTAKS